MPILTTLLGTVALASIGVQLLTVAYLFLYAFLLLISVKPDQSTVEIVIVIVI